MPSGPRTWARHGTQPRRLSSHIHTPDAPPRLAAGRSAPKSSRNRRSGECRQTEVTHMTQKRGKTRRASGHEAANVTIRSIEARTSTHQGKEGQHAAQGGRGRPEQQRASPAHGCRDPREAATRPPPAGNREREQGRRRRGRPRSHWSRPGLRHRTGQLARPGRWEPRCAGGGATWR